MIEVTFPGPWAPAFTPVVVTCPDDWEPIRAAGVMLAIAGPSTDRLFRPNLTVSIQRVLQGLSLDAVSEQLLAATRATYPDLELGERVTGEVSGLPAVAYEYAFTHPQAGTLFQIQTVVLASPGDEVLDLIQIHASCAGAEAEKLVGLLRSTIATIALG